jgi:hypothetical protein
VLALGHRLDAAAPDLAEEGAGIERQAERRRRPGVDAEPEDVGPEKGEEELHQQRCALKELDVTDREIAQRRDPAGARQRHGEAADSAAEKCDERQGDRPARRRQDEEELIGAEAAHPAQPRPRERKVRSIVAKIVEKPSDMTR